MCWGIEEDIISTKGKVQKHLQSVDYKLVNMFDNKINIEIENI